MQLSFYLTTCGHVKVVGNQDKGDANLNWLQNSWVLQAAYKRHVRWQPTGGLNAYNATSKVRYQAAIGVPKRFFNPFTKPCCRKLTFQQGSYGFFVTLLFFFFLLKRNSFFSFLYLIFLFWKYYRIKYVAILILESNFVCFEQIWLSAP